MSKNSNTSSYTTKISQLLDVLTECNSHLKYIDYAVQKLAPLLPFTLNSCAAMQEEDVSHLDQFILRFIKLQDTVGGRLFKSVLDNIGELKGNEPFIDIINKLEKFGVVKFEQVRLAGSGEQVHEWGYIREKRNAMAHDYPATFRERVAATNTVMGYLPRLYEIYRDAKKYITDKVLVNAKEVKLARYKMPQTSKPQAFEEQLS